MLYFTDTLTGSKVKFEPRDLGKVSIYWCGPTVYDKPHLGHARSTLIFDILVRYLRWSGWDVCAVSNITDIDDKIIARAAEEKTTEPKLSAHYEQIFIDEMDRLNITHPDIRPRATEYINAMISVITTLIDEEMAYITNSGVYFDVDQLEDYGTLVHRNISDLREGAGARVDVDENKNDPLDFALWKSAKPGEPSWDSPWGPGRPGWHIECVAMSLDLLGDGFDIHGGGDDLVFPHHENERAEALGCGRNFARYWIHNGMVQVEGEKMSKSLGNFTTLGDLLDRWDPRALRLLVLQTHYRRTMEISSETIDGAAAALNRLDSFADRIATTKLPEAQGDDAVIKKFKDAMDDDLGTPTGVAVIFDAVRDANRALDNDEIDRAAELAVSIKSLTEAFGLILGRAKRPGQTIEDNDEIAMLVRARDAAREKGNYSEADKIRDELTERGIILEDSAQGTSWHSV